MKKIRYAGLLLFLMVTLAACSGNEKGQITTGQYYNPNQDQAGQKEPEIETETDMAAVEKPETDADLFMITHNDMQQEILLLEQVASGKQYMYHYSLATRFLDKYGNRTNVSSFDPGRIIEINEKDSWGKVTEVQVSDEVWEYPEIVRFSVDEERGVFTIADTHYDYDERLFVTSGGVSQELSDLSDMDELRVIGIGKKLLSVSVTTGHGVLKLENTELFDGSFVQIGERIFTEITGPMSLDIPEGDYLVTVANNGYGGSTEVTIERGKETLLNLETLKGEGPKFGVILFAVDVPDAIVQVDGQVIDHTEEIPLQYGVHTLTVTAAGYETYTKKLFVNSETATIVIGMSGEGSSDSADQMDDTDSTGEETDSEKMDTGDVAAGSLAGSQAGTHGSAGSAAGNSQNSSSGNASMSEEEVDVLVNELLNGDDDDDGTSDADYVSTITELLGTVSGL